MVERPMVGVRVPQVWKEILEEISYYENEPVSKILYDLIDQYVNGEVDNTVIRVERPNRRTAEVDLAQVITTLATLSAQVKGLEAKIATIVAEQLKTALSDLTSTPTKPLKTALSPQFGKLPKTVKIGGEDHSLTTEALTTGEAYKICQERGLDRCLGTFREWLTEAVRRGYLPLELQELGLEADFKLRRASHPKNKYLRWLRCRYEDF